MNTRRWILERGRISCQRHTYTSCSDAERNVVSFCWESEGVCWWRFGVCRSRFETEQQRTWNHIPKRNCMWDTLFQNTFDSVEMRNTCQVTNQSSHGELSFHHNPHLRLWLGLGPLYFPRYSERGLKIETCSSPYMLSLM